MAFVPSVLFNDEILEFLASSPTAQQSIDYLPPIILQQRLSELLDKNRASRLTEAEAQELGEFLRLNRFMSRLKMKARERLLPASD